MKNNSNFKHSDRTAFLPKRFILGSAVMLALVVPVHVAPVHAQQTASLESNHSALITDNMLVAQAHGWTYDQAAAHYRAAQTVGVIAEQIAKHYPDVFVGSALSDSPGGTPSVYIKGEATAEIRRLFQSAMTTASAVRVNLVDKQPYSFRELEKRKFSVHGAMVQSGFDQVSTGFRIDEQGTIRTGVTTKMQYDPQYANATVDFGINAVTQTATSAIANLPADLRDSVILDVSVEDIVEDEHAYGGLRIRSSSSRCTTGWTVVNQNGTTGVTTAGHCSGMRYISSPGAGRASHVKQHRGEWGDIEWKTTNHVEPAEFYASSSTRRVTRAVEPIANISQGESICLYGRSSNRRNCSLRVERLSQACTNSGVWNNRLVLMDGDIGIGGDSGGGWSYNTTAFGSHKGNCSGRDAFSVADLFDEALGVTVRTK